MKPGVLRSARTMETRLSTLGQAYIRVVVLVPPTAYGSGREEISQPLWRSEVNLPSRVAPSLIWWRVSARNVAMVKPWSRVATSLTGRQSRREIAAMIAVRGVIDPFEPKAPPT
jgi:hypothetical protein